MIHVILAGTMIGQMLHAKQRYRTCGGMCTRQASKRRTVCTDERCGRSASARYVMIRNMSFASFQALFWRIRYTFAGAAACRAASCPAGRVVSLAIKTWGSTGWMSGRSQMKATWVKQHLRLAREALSTGSSAGGSRRFLKTTVPFPPPWNKQTEVSSILMRRIDFPSGTRLAQQLYHCHTAFA